MEQLVNFITWVFVLTGLTSIVSMSGIFMPIRQKIFKLNPFLGQLISCPMCFGFWAGLILSYFYQSITGNMFFDAVLGSGMMWYMTYEPPQMPHQH